jgi:MFS family permease
VPRRATLSGVVGVSALLGAALGSVLGSVLRSGTGFLVAGALTAALGVAAVLVAPDPPRVGPAANPAPGPRWWLPRGAPDFWWAFWARFLLVVGYFMVNGFQLYLFTDRVGLSSAAAGAAVATTSVVFLVAAVLGSAVVGPLSDRLGRRKIFVVGASLLAVLAGAVPFVLATVAGMLGFAVLGGLAFGTYYAVDQALLSEVLPDASSRAADLAVFAAATSAGQVLAPAISAGLVAVGGFTPLFLVAMAMCAGAAACVRPIRSVP